MPEAIATAHFLQSSFSPGELTELVLTLADGDALLATLPGEGLPHAQRCLELARLLERRGGLNDEFLTSLIRSRPARSLEVEALRLNGGSAMTGDLSIFVTSALAGRTLTMSVSENTPAGLLLDRSRAAFGVPEGLTWAGLRIRLLCHLALGERLLEPGLPLGIQGVRDGVVLTLLVERREQADVESSSAAGGRLVWRGHPRGA